MLFNYRYSLVLVQDLLFISSLLKLTYCRMLLINLDFLRIIVNNTEEPYNNDIKKTGELFLLIFLHRNRWHS